MTWRRGPLAIPPTREGQESLSPQDTLRHKAEMDRQEEEKEQGQRPGPKV